MAIWSTGLAVAMAYTHARAGSMKERIDRSVARVESPTDGDIHSRVIRSAVSAQTVFHPNLPQQDIKVLTDALADHTDRKHAFQAKL
jgi:hypothetical protein